MQNQKNSSPIHQSQGMQFCKEETETKKLGHIFCRGKNKTKQNLAAWAWLSSSTHYTKISVSKTHKSFKGVIFLFDPPLAKKTWFSKQMYCLFWPSAMGFIFVAVSSKKENDKKEGKITKNNFHTNSHSFSRKFTQIKFDQMSGFTNDFI